MRIFYQFVIGLLGLLCVTIFPHALMAQNNTKTITGKVVEQKSNLLLPGANISIVGTKKGTSTNLKGKFELSGLQSQTYQLKISYLGYSKQSIAVDLRSGNSKNILVTLVPDLLELSEVTVKSENSIDRVNIISQVDIKLRPVENTQDILRVVPGLFIGQHAGGGKAEQIFLRGFDIDHGTDINISVDGMPVNMVSHAHGQGYSDLHFVIPETIEKVDFNKGPYYTDKGNFNTAGYAAFTTKRALNKSQVSLEAGQFNSYRGSALLNLYNSDDGKSHAYVAGGYLNREGYFISSQDFTRLNLFGKYTTQLSPSLRFTVSASTFNSEWTASGQIPARAVESGQITEFGAIDDTEGGNTSRTNLNIKIDQFIGDNTLIEHRAYFSNYDFRLFSNFTFFLDDPINGDQIRQSENRNIYGYKGAVFFDGNINEVPFKSTIGAGFRYDDINDIRLSETRDRSITLNDLARGQVDELNAFAYIDEEINLTQKLTINPGIRLDFFNSQYQDELLPGNPTLKEQQAILSPKFNIEYNFNEQNKVYLKTGSGFHSNDSRAVVARNGRQILPKAYGADLGVLGKPTSRLIINPAVWILYLQQEFVYVGDGGEVEPSGRTRRLGADLSMRYQILDWLYADLDFNYTYARSLDAPSSQNRIPLAPKITSIAGLSFNFTNGLNGSLRYRTIGNRPANENNSITAEGYFVVDAVLNYTRKQYEVGISVQNLFDTQWKETQFAYESQLRNEVNPVNEIHFTPGTPFNAKASVKVFF